MGQAYTGAPHTPNFRLLSEAVPSWSSAEDLTPIERSEGLKIVGRHRPTTVASYPNNPQTRTLVDINDPAVRGSALWVAHALMASYHEDASDRTTGIKAQSRQRARFSAAAPPGRAWLAERMQMWPETYRRNRWIDVSPSSPECENVALHANR
jgi:hypothetical protein